MDLGKSGLGRVFGLQRDYRLVFRLDLGIHIRDWPQLN